jgi:hypothetical protein
MLRDITVEDESLTLEAPLACSSSHQRATQC